MANFRTHFGQFARGNSATGDGGSVSKIDFTRNWGAEIVTIRKLDGTVRPAVVFHQSHNRFASGDTLVTHPVELGEIKRLLYAEFRNQSQDLRGIRKSLKIASHNKAILKNLPRACRPSSKPTGECCPFYAEAHYD